MECSEVTTYFGRLSLIFIPQTRKLTMRTLQLLAFCCIYFSLQAQLPVPSNGTPLKPQNSFVLTDVTIRVSPDKTIENGTIIVRDGLIQDVGKTVILPNDLPIIPGNGKVVVPAFIEIHSTVGIPELKGKGWDPSPQMESKKNGPYYWNEAIHPEIDPTDLYAIDPQAIDELHKMGFGLAVTHQADGIARGTGTLVTLGKQAARDQIITPQIASFYSFRKGVSQQSYPSSQMGAIALLRQAFYDAEWHATYGKEPNYSLDALWQQRTKPSIFATSDVYELLRVHQIAREFNRKFLILGTGHEYELGNIWDSLPHTLVIPLTFPDAFEVKDPYVARQIPLADLKHWDLAPGNPAYLFQQKVPFLVTSTGIKNAADFWKNIHKALAHGWSVEDALRALTTGPATQLGIDKQFGTIEKDKWASFSLFDSDPFLYEAKVTDVFVKGLREVKATLPEADIRGVYSLNIDGVKHILTIAGSCQRPEAKVGLPRLVKDEKTGQEKKDTLTVDAFLQYNENDLVLQFSMNHKTLENYSLKGILNTRVWIVEGQGTNASGKWIKWSAIRNKGPEKNQAEPVWKSTPEFQMNPSYPNMAFGFDKRPQEETIIFENATVWTNEAEGILSNATVVVSNGKIKAVYAGSAAYTVPAGARVINAQGKHLTAGIIDEHSHIAISKGVNEGGQAISAEVRIGDVVTADDINVYRQLSGGVTAAQLLHGSANPIGGQSALIKLKWGHLPQDYLIKNAPKFVKFALGENVKQANWGDFNTTRFPQTRMGVEQVYVDAFARALAYHDARQKDKTIPRDLELDALYEIVTGDRKISCHSYIQSEINMLMHVADSFGFKVNTFTHILEGYKVADKMKEHGAGASTFSDWWAYKFEVKDAVPFNASLMHQMGLVVAINSDDGEMGRRLNQEAAKVIKYGGVTEEEAWKMVTLNPAKLLHLDDRMGSVKAGKDADLVLWTTNPLSIEAKVLYTIVDGEILFDRDADLKKQQEMDAERARIIAKMVDATKKGEPTKPFVRKKRGAYHCSTLGEELSTGHNEH